MRLNYCRCAMRGMLMLAGLLAGAPAVRAAEAARVSDPPAASAALIDELRRGGFVIFFRHAATDAPGAYAFDATADLARCETQRNLSRLGREQAANIGEAFRGLRIPVGAVLASPFCRARDTAGLAFGRHEVDLHLYFAMDAGPDGRRKLAESLKRMLSTPPAEGVNTVLVSHTANLREATGIWPKPEGVAYVFRPLSGGGFEAVAKVLPEEWSAFARRGPAALSR